MITNTEEIGIKVASALLLQYGELSIEDIRAIPFLSYPDEVEKVVQQLTQLFNVEIYQKQISTDPIPEWEKIIKLKTSNK